MKIRFAELIGLYGRPGDKPIEVRQCRSVRQAWPGRPALGRRGFWVAAESGRPLMVANTRHGLDRFLAWNGLEPVRNGKGERNGVSA